MGLILITGGAYQGKRAFAKERFGLSVEDIADGVSCGFEAAMTARCIAGFHELVRRLMAEGVSPTDFAERLCKENPDAVVIINEVGCGVIPLEKEERLWRGEVGSCGILLAENAECVVRMVCGVPAVIKGEL